MCIILDKMMKRSGAVVREMDRETQPFNQKVAGGGDGVSNTLIGRPKRERLP